MVVSTLALSLAVLELALRASEGTDLRRELEARTLGLRESSHPDLAYELLPGAEGFIWETWVKISPQGLRDRVYELEKLAGIRRIAVLGDSVAFGTGLAVEATFSDQLEKVLDGADVEVLNLSVGGYDVLDYVARLEHTGLAFEPDLVLIAYCVNDIGVYSPNLFYLRAAQRLDSRMPRLRILQRLLRDAERTDTYRAQARENQDEFFAERFAGRIAPVSGDPELMALVQRLRELLAEEPEGLEGEPFLAAYASEPKLGRLRYSLERIARLTAEHGFQARMVLMPYLDRPRNAEAWDLVSQILEHECRRMRIPFLDPFPAFAEVDLEAFRLREGDGVHFTGRAHSLVASSLRKWLDPWIAGAH